MSLKKWIYGSVGLDRTARKREAAGGVPWRLNRRVRKTCAMLHDQRTGGREKWVREKMFVAYSAARVPADQSVVELGAMFGQTTCFLAHGAAYAKAKPVWAFDQFRCRDENGRHELARGPLREFRKTVRRAGVESHVMGVASSSTAAAAAWDGSPVGLLVLDAGAGVLSCRDEYEAWRPHLADGARVILHGCRGSVPAVIETDSLRGFEMIGSLRVATHHAIQQYDAAVRGLDALRAA